MSVGVASKWLCLAGALAIAAISGCADPKGAGCAPDAPSIRDRSTIEPIHVGGTPIVADESQANESSLIIDPDTGFGDPPRKTVYDRPLLGHQLTRVPVLAALSWIARHQARNGSWSFTHFQEFCKDGSCTSDDAIESQTAATALALMPFVAIGQTHQQSGSPYQKVVLNGAYWLVSHQKNNGEIHDEDSPRPMFEHALAAIVLCDLYRYSRDKLVADAAQKSLTFIIQAQNQQTSGWDDHPDDTGNAFSTAWQLTALASGRMAGLTVDPNVFERTEIWLNSVSNDVVGHFSFLPTARPTVTSTAAALLSLEAIGIRREDPRIGGGVRYVVGSFADENSQNVLSWFFATRAMTHWRDPNWDIWNRKVRTQLAATQRREGCAAGSWDLPTNPASPWHCDGGRLMMTSLNCQIMESCGYSPVPRATSFCGYGVRIDYSTIRQTNAPSSFHPNVGCLMTPTVPDASIPFNPDDYLKLEVETDSDP